jgi:N-acetylmuramoyl-L-alanine amidase
VASSLDWCRRPESKVSYHVLIGRKGDIYQLVAPERRAWHCGVSAWDGVPNCNDYTLGVCLSNRNDGEEEYPLAQLWSAAQVCRALMDHFQIAGDRIISHAAVATPAGRKTDPKGLDIEAFQRVVAGVIRQP